MRIITSEIIEDDWDRICEIKVKVAFRLHVLIHDIFLSRENDLTLKSDLTCCLPQMWLAVAFLKLISSSSVILERLGECSFDCVLAVPYLRQHFLPKFVSSVFTKI